MDDIYFSRKDKKNGTPDEGKGKSEFSLPPLNAQSKKPGSGEYYAPEDDLSSFSDEEQGFFDDSPGIRQEQPRDVYAPYMGRAKKIKKSERPAADENPGTAQPAESTPVIKKKRHTKAKLIALLLAAAIIAPVIAVFAAAVSADYTRNKLHRNEFISASELASDSKIKNILFLGVDGKTGEDNLRSDSMILVSIDSLHKKIKLSSFMRDSWIEIPDYKEAKLNAACSHGGPQLVADTIEYNFKVDIDDYILVNFDMFTEIIDAIGGIDVEVTEKEARFINKTTRWTVESGESVHLNGAEALVYARIRKLDSDYMRTFRQRKIIKAIIKQAKKSGPFRLWKILNGVLPKVETSLSAPELTGLAFKGAFALLAYDTVSTRIPTNSLSEGGYRKGQSVVLLDIPANAEFLYDFIYNDKTDSEGVDEN